MKADIDLTVRCPYPAPRVWAALTSSEALAAWLMPNDFQPVVGHRFAFRTKRLPVSTAWSGARCRNSTRRAGWPGPGPGAGSTPR